MSRLEIRRRRSSVSDQCPRIDHYAIDEALPPPLPPPPAERRDSFRAVQEATTQMSVLNTLFSGSLDHMDTKTKMVVQVQRSWRKLRKRRRLISNAADEGSQALLNVLGIRHSNVISLCTAPYVAAPPHRRSAANQ